MLAQLQSSSLCNPWVRACKAEDRRGVERTDGLMAALGREQQGCRKPASI